MSCCVSITTHEMRGAFVACTGNYKITLPQFRKINNSSKRFEALNFNSNNVQLNHEIKHNVLLQKILETVQV